MFIPDVKLNYSITIHGLPSLSSVIFLPTCGLTLQHGTHSFSRCSFDQTRELVSLFE